MRSRTVALAAVLLVGPAALATGCGGIAAESAICSEVSANRSKAESVAKSVFDELQGIEASQQHTPGGGNAIASAKERFPDGYRAAIAPVREACRRLGPTGKPYWPAVRTMAGELGLS